MTAARPLEPVRRMTLQEYLAFEEASEARHEFHDGEVLAMSGGTFAHAMITTNANGEVRNRLRGARCSLLDSNMRVRIGAANRYVYPDGLIFCGKPEFDPTDSRQTTLLNPTVILETLSDSTESYDRGEKFGLYRTLPSLREYVLISQDKPLVETFLRHDDGSWRLDVYAGMEAVAKLRSVEVDLPLAEVYRGLELERAG